jgi:hypothetical protein
VHFEQKVSDLLPKQISTLAGTAQQYGLLVKEDYLLFKQGGL